MSRRCRSVPAAQTAEVANSGVDPATRGRRMDESLALVRRLLAGDVVDHRGDHFTLASAAIRPTPEPAVPIVVGGRAPVALRRAGWATGGSASG